jgi:hypothetical protein
VVAAGHVQILQDSCASPSTELASHAATTPNTTRAQGKCRMRLKILNSQCLRTYLLLTPPTPEGWNLDSTLSNKQPKTKNQQTMGEKSHLMTPEAVSDFIDNQRKVLLENLATQRKSLIALIEGRKAELRIFSGMEVAKGLLGREDRVQAELTILTRRLSIVESKERQLEKYQIEAKGRKVVRDSKVDLRGEVSKTPTRNFSRKIKGQAAV